MQCPGSLPVFLSTAKSATSCLCRLHVRLVAFSLIWSEAARDDEKTYSKLPRSEEGASPFFHLSYITHIRPAVYSTLNASRRVSIRREAFISSPIDT